MVSIAAWLRFERSHSKYTTNSDVGHAAAAAAAAGGGGTTTAAAQRPERPGSELVTQTNGQSLMLIIGVIAGRGQHDVEPGVSSTPSNDASGATK
jgi:hypothetical protein